jgi:NTE family protein
MENFPQGIQTFGQLEKRQGIRCFTLAACLETEQARIFGDQPDDSLLDGAMASAALPPYFAPWRVQGRRYVDGGVYTNLPLRAAVERGATRLTALWIKPSIQAHPPDTGMVQITSSAFTMMVRNLSALELAWVEAQAIPVEVIELIPPSEVRFWDFSQSDRLIEHGRQAAKAWLESAESDERKSWWQGLLNRLRHGSK